MYDLGGKAALSVSIVILLALFCGVGLTGGRCHLGLPLFATGFAVFAYDE